MSVNAKSAEDFVSDCQPDVCTTSLVRSKWNSIKSGTWSKYRKALVILFTASVLSRHKTSWVLSPCDKTAYTTSQIIENFHFEIKSRNPDFKDECTSSKDE